MKIDRLLAITMQFLSRRTVTASQLAEKFEVTVRTIYRDIETLKNAGIPIVASQGIGGGYGIHGSFSIDRQMLTVDDMLSILISLKSLEATFANNASGSSDLFDKINALVPQRERSRMDALITRTRIDLHPWGCNKATRKNLAAIQRALANNYLVSLTYRAANGAASRRTIEPAQLIYKTHAWYAYGYCYARQEFRLFRLSRISDCSVELQHFVPRPVPPVDDLLRLDTRPRVQVTLRFALQKRAQVEEYFSPEALTVNIDGSVNAVLEMPEDDWLYGMILSYGETVEVLSPAYMRTIIREKAKKIFSTYQT